MGEEAGGIRSRGEEVIGELAQSLLENPLFSQALGKALGAGERAAGAQRAALNALDVPSAGDLAAAQPPGPGPLRPPRGARGRDRPAAARPLGLIRKPERPERLGRPVNRIAAATMAPQSGWLTLNWR